MSIIQSNIQTTMHGNHLLNGLNHKNRQTFMQDCELVDLKLGEILGNPGERVSHLFFPTDSIISWEKQIVDNPYLLITLVGNEGALFITLMLGIATSPCRAVVRKSGQALRITTTDFLKQIDQNAAINSLLKRYTFVAYDQVVQTAACNLFHLLENRLARLLLMFQDRSTLDELQITQELLSQMLGVRRVGVTKAAGSLQAKKLISYSRGHVIIHDRVGLEVAACRCYQSDQARYATILNDNFSN